MQWAVLLARLLFGGAYLIFGANFYQIGRAHV